MNGLAMAVVAAQTSAVGKEAAGAEKQILVLDIPLSTTPDEAARLLEEPYERGFYIHRAMEWTGGARVIYVHRVKPADKPERLNKEATAMQFLRDNREMTAKELSAAFKAIGFPRSAQWITQKRLELMRVERHAHL
jgi:hypothetical protein